MLSAGLSTTTTTTSEVENVSNTIDIANMTNATRVAGVFEVEIEVRGNLSKIVVEDMFKRAIAAAVELPVEFVVKSEVSEINRSVQDNMSLSEANDTLQNNLSSGSRRLQAIQTKWFEVSYELLVPSHMDADAIIERANRIAVSGSEESKLFRDILMSTDGVERIGEINATVPASKIVATTAAPTNSKEEESSWKSIVIGLSVAFVIVICLGLSAVLIKRKLMMDGSNGQPGADVENGHLEPVSMQPQPTTEAVADAAKEDAQPTTEVKAPLVYENTAPKPQAEQFAHTDDVVLAEIPSTKGKERIVKERIIHM
jgi:hypothetical protein